MTHSNFGYWDQVNQPADPIEELRCRIATVERDLKSGLPEKMKQEKERSLENLQCQLAREVRKRELFG